MTEQMILGQLQMLPDNLKQEVVDFMGYLLQKYQREQKQNVSNGSETIALSHNLDTVLMEDAELLEKLAQ